MKRIVLAISVIFLLACQDRKADSCKQEFQLVPIGGKLEKLLSLPQDTVLDYYDLSNDFLFDFPDLSGYTIKSLDLSHNYLDTFVEVFLPQELEVLNLSANYLNDFPHVGWTAPIRNLRDLNLSHNYLRRFGYSYYISRLDLSYNNLLIVRLFATYGPYIAYLNKDLAKKFNKRMSYLNISHNPGLSNEVWFRPAGIDTVIYNNIANDKKLKMNTIVPLPHYDIVFEE